MIDHPFIHLDIIVSCLLSSFRPGTLLDFRSQDLAEQLTLLDSELFYKIEVQVLTSSYTIFSLLTVLLSPLTFSSVCFTCL